jgi:RNA polymerase sigma-70 factor (sigma-E family)
VDRDSDFTAFVEARSARLLHIAHMLCGDLARAEDLTQAALEKAYLKWDRIEHADPFGYVRQIIVNEHRAQLRRRPWREQPQAEFDPEPGGTDPASVVGRREAFVRMLAALTPRERSVLALRFADDLTLAEIARVLGITLGSVKRTNARALDKLRGSVELTGPAVGGRP